MLNLNSCMFCGRLTADPELKFVGESKVVNINLAVNRRKGKDGTQLADFIPLVIWDRSAEIVAKYCHKGDPLYVRGSLRFYEYEKNGEKRRNAEIVVSEIELCGEKKAVDSNATIDTQNTIPGAASCEDCSDDLPF